MNYKTIIIANIAEAFEDLLSKVKPPEKKIKKIQIEHNLCDRTLLWEGDDKVLITPFPISPLTFEINKKVLNFNNCINIFPKRIKINLSEAIIKDRTLMERLIDIIKSNPGINISPYAVTPSFICLIDHLWKKDLKFIVKEKPYKYSNWTTQFLDSKVGSRVEIDKIKNKNINTPQSIICRNRDEVMSVAEWFYKRDLSCVIKVNFGEGGWGTLMIKKEDYKSWQEALIKIRKEFTKDSIWDDSLLLVEEYISSERGVSSGCPSSELFLSEKGPRITYICDQIVTKEGNFLGVASGKDSLNKRVKDKIDRASMLVGKRFWELGYRGFFDIDFVLSKRKEVPYIIETNMRRTGGTHIFDVARSIFGERWGKKVFFLSRDSFCYGKKKLSEKVIFERMKDFLFPIKGDKIGVIISIVNKWQPNFGFIIIEKSPGRAVKLYSKIMNLWNIKN